MLVSVKSIFSFSLVELIRFIRITKNQIGRGMGFVKRAQGRYRESQACSSVTTNEDTLTLIALRPKPGLIWRVSFAWLCYGLECA